jgi:hypothetical protein
MYICCCLLHSELVLSSVHCTTAWNRVQYYNVLQQLVKCSSQQVHKWTHNVKDVSASPHVSQLKLQGSISMNLGDLHWKLSDELNLPSWQFTRPVILLYMNVFSKTVHRTNHWYEIKNMDFITARSMYLKSFSISRMYKKAKAKAKNTRRVRCSTLRILCAGLCTNWIRRKTRKIDEHQVHREIQVRKQSVWYFMALLFLTPWFPNVVPKYSNYLKFEVFIALYNDSALHRGAETLTYVLSFLLSLLLEQPS